ncbi:MULTISPECIES: type II toxin-antitoxin system RelE/ParE family toxin [unclassified Tolypothrix]|uniref:type II toxin-antitoxin system RelE/ParE family toxin n=1 Tax=unclassified Tolypothrix TaxID=2649714 RepID=UPI0005EAB6E4|nr:MULTISPECIES: type II toxin-antitoxin system RelE/ParE family toxin [unclassified Tolypothrix]EKF03029.1 putative plasmid stabilization system protein [Tolypothrix sp. PCC 7601]BAY92922.1 plasmid stabilization system [Microchaete diplosiphon NIES-3275]
MSNYIISPAAIQDLDEIADYFASRNLDAGDRFVNSFAEKCKNLAKYPNMGRSYADIEPLYYSLPCDY